MSESNLQKSIPLCVDLDGTLIKTDLLIVSFFTLIKRKPWYLIAVPLWVLKGKAYFKHQIAKRTDLDIPGLPFHPEFLNFLKDEKVKERKLLLTSAANQKYVKQIADYLGIFDDWIGSDSRRNISGYKKLDAIQTMLCDAKFCYAGNAKVDLKVWAHASSAILVNPHPGIAKRANRLTQVENHFEEKRSSFSNLLFFKHTIWFWGLFGLLAVMAVTKYNSLHSSYFDLGAFLFHFTNFSSGQEWRLFSGHSHPLIFIWSWFYQLLPSNWAPEIILSAQAALLACPVIWLKRHYGFVAAIAYTLYFPLWYNALFDFHLDHLAVPLLFGFFFLVHKENIFGAVILALLLALVKEPFALQTSACGLYLILFKKHPWAGITLVTVGLSWFFVSSHYLVPFFSQGPAGGLESPAFSWLGNGLSEIIWFILSKPHIILGEIVSSERKITYLISIFGALGFISLLKPSPLLIAVPVLAISLLSKFDNYSGLQFHYTAGLIAPLTIAFAEGLPKAKRIANRIGIKEITFVPLVLIALLGFHIKHAPSPISLLFWNSKSWNYHYSAYLITDREKRIKRAILAHIPIESGVGVSTQNTINLGHLAHHKFYFSFPDGILQPNNILQSSDRYFIELWKFINTGEMTKKTEEKWADFIVLDLKRPWFIGDEGCPWINGQCKNNEEFASRFLALVQQTKERFETVYKEDGFYILKRKSL
jgi:uncharacterized membrane protein